MNQTGRMKVEAFGIGGTEAAYLRAEVVA